MIRCMPALQVADIKRSEAFHCESLGCESPGTWGEGSDDSAVQLSRVTVALDRAWREADPDLSAPGRPHH